VHGLGANKDYAWVKKLGDKRVNWLKDLLPKTFASAVPRIHARIFCYNYDTRWLGAETCTQRLTILAEKLLAAWSRLSSEVRVIKRYTIDLSDNMKRTKLQYSLRTPMADWSLRKLLCSRNSEDPRSKLLKRRLEG